MKRIAIFLEGESEIIFSSYLIKVLHGLNGIRLNYISWKSDDAYQHDFKPKEGHGKTKIEFTLFNCGNDQRVVDKLRENGKSMLREAYHAVIGLRDVRGQKYDKLAGSKMNPAKIEIMISNTRVPLEEFEGVELFFAVMELEAWYLALTKCLVRVGYHMPTINTKIGINLEKIDPEKYFYKPKSSVKSFVSNFNEIKFAYKIGSELRISDIEGIKANNKVKHFIEYANTIESYR